MRIKFTDQLFTIPAGQAFSGIAKQPQTLQIAGGAAWITVEGSSRDHWLNPGERLTLEPGRLVVIEAGATDSRVALQQIAAGSPHTLGHQLREWLAALAQRLHATRQAATPKTCHCS